MVEPDVYPTNFFSHTSSGTGSEPEKKTGVNLAAGDEGNAVAHTLGHEASFIQAWDSTGAPLDLTNWKPDPANLTTKILIFTELELLGITLKIF